VTSEEDVALLRMALSGAANKRLVSGLVSRGAPALGVSGEDAALLSARRIGGDMGFVGEPARVRADVLRYLLAGDLLPVVSPVSADVAGTGALNVNGDDAAAAVAVALGADELLFVSDVAAVSLDGREARRIAVDDIGAVLSRPDVSGGMVAKLEAARVAVLGGVGRVRIGDLALLGGEGGTVIERHRSAA
jgi:acetylglutamate kinase